MIVVDASVIVQSLLRLPGAEAIDERLSDAEGALHAPHLLEMEVAHAVRKLALRGVIGGGRGARALDYLRGYGVSLYPHGRFLERVWALRHSASCYDACYIALAETLGAPLLTRDRRLAASSGHVARIEVMP